MSEYPRKGDRVKVTYEGVVTKADDMLHRHFEVNGVYVPTKGARVEVTRRASYGQGTVLHVAGMDVFKTSAGWVWEDGSKSCFNDHFFRTYPGLKVVREPAA